MELTLAVAHPITEGFPDGRNHVFVCIVGHYMWTFDDPLCRLLLLRGIAWTAREPTTRLDVLCLDGAPVAD